MTDGKKLIVTTRPFFLFIWCRIACEFFTKMHALSDGVISTMSLPCMDGEEIRNSFLPLDIGQKSVYMYTFLKQSINQSIIIQSIHTTIHPNHYFSPRDPKEGRKERQTCRCLWIRRSVERAGVGVGRSKDGSKEGRKEGRGHGRIA